MPNLSELVSFHSGQVEKSIDKYKCIKLINSLHHILIHSYKFTCCIENSVDPDQLASSEAS